MSKLVTTTKKAEIFYPARELRRNEAMAHLPVTVEVTSVEKSNKYTRLIRGTRALTRTAMNNPRVR